MATRRYVHGDALGAAVSGATPRRPVDPAATTFAERIRARLGEQVRCIPVVHPTDVAQPTTVGLGDAFVGGFLGALVGALPYGRADPTRRRPVGS